jgi:hypothetical protein
LIIRMSQQRLALPCSSFQSRSFATNFLNEDIHD